MAPKLLVGAALLGGAEALEAFVAAPCQGSLRGAAAPRSGHDVPNAAAEERTSRPESCAGNLLVGLGLGSAAATLAGAVSRRRRAVRASRRAAGENLPNALPFLGPPAYRAFAANVPGDAGFDPLNLWKGEVLGTFAGVPMQMRDAELKYGRLAMLAALHWPAAELFNRELAVSVGQPSELVGAGLIPSLLNGGLSGNAPLDTFLSLAVVAAGILDMSKDRMADPGDYGFDPLGLKCVSLPMAGLLPLGRSWMAEAEVKHGRLAMIAITAFAAQEFVSKVPVVKETPALFGGVL